MHAYWEGWRALEEGKFCPYSRGTTEYREWQRGLTDHFDLIYSPVS